ncbi:hypothetical protein ABH945_001203 [Paraburkholderia sp. GAS333]
MSRFYRNIGSWLGLLAILMATLAPTISQTLAARAERGAMADEHCDMVSMDSMQSMHAMPQMGSMSSMRDATDDAPQASTPTSDSTTKHTQMSDGDACGYCSLLAHLPVMPGVETLFVAAVRTRQHVVATRFKSVRRVEPLTFAQPRAPPFIA